ncbi:MAG TPA: AMP-binding protein [Steroidobacteraceae bacterium]|nr:AMP-binding protein [Steroidobacteraceae bacterium]
MDVTPLLSHPSAGAIVAYRAGRAIAAGEFLADTAQLAERLPRAEHVLNACVDRYQFAVGLAACLTTGRVSLLPSTHTPQLIKQLAELVPDAVCLTDEPCCDIDLPRVYFPGSASGQGRPRAALAFRVPRIPCAQTAAIVFTSGTTGAPLPYRKTWGRLARCVRDGAQVLGLDNGRPHTLIGTVPPQHMYGFESTVLLALQSGNSFGAERPFFPADIASVIAATPRPRALITTPVHLRALLAAGLELPPVDLIVSATAPLAAELAREAEERFAARLLEIYGSTETGQIALRRTRESHAWKLWPGVRLHADDGRVYAHGGHVEQMTPMCDLLEIIGEDEFELRGRTADLVNVAGKRSSFGYLNSQLNAIPGVLDGAFFLRESNGAGVTGIVRLAAAVVAPGLTVASLMECLRHRIDPVFLPRPLLLVDRLPRNATGKLPLEALELLTDRYLGSPEGESGASR